MPQSEVEPPSARDPAVALTAAKSQHKTSLWLAGSLAVLILILLLALTASLYKKLDHDEHQFIASAYVLAKQGLLPYLDYPYHHVPYLSAAYSLLFHLSDHLLRAARLLSASCGILAVLLVASYARKTFASAEPRLKYGVAIGCVILLVASPVFVYSSGLAWNHDASILLGLAASLVFLTGTETRSIRPRYLFASGILLGLAIGVRLTLFPLTLPFIAGLYVLSRKQTSTWIRSTAWFCSGLLLALLPLLALFFVSPAEFLHGNFGYPLLNTEYREATGYRRAMSPPAKVLFFLERVAADPGNLIVFALLGFVLAKIGLRNLKDESNRQLTLLLALILFAYLGSFAPTPSFPQYFYAPMPFIVMAAVSGVARLQGRELRAVLRFFSVALIVSALRGVPAYWGVFQPGQERPRTTETTHALGLEIRALTGPGRVLTLAPAFPAEGGLDIYPELVTGPFAWRTGFLLAKDERAKLRIVSPAELDELLRRRPAAGILVGTEPEDLERPLIDFARRSGYSPVPLSGEIVVWVPE